MKTRRPADNPFASHRVEALPYRNADASVSGLVDRIREMGGRAAIVGPEGSGKTTLLEELASCCEDRAVMIRLPGSCAHPWRTARQQVPDHLDSNRSVFVDGSEQLRVIGWLRLRVATRRAGSLVVTLHRPGRLPTLIECRTDPDLLRKLVAELAPEDAAELDPMLDALFHRHAGDIRLCLRELYDVYAGRKEKV